MMVTTLTQLKRQVGWPYPHLWEVLGFHPRLLMLLPCGERATPGLLVRIRRTTRLPEGGQRVSFQPPGEGLEMASIKNRALLANKK